MPIEVKEYEAYVATLSMKSMVENPKDIETILFGFFIGSSVETHNKEISDRKPYRIN
jgi:hypothetical protein